MESLKIKRDLIVIELIIQGVEILLLFLPWMFNWEHWERYDDVWGGGYTLIARFERSFVDILGLTNVFWGYMVIVFMAINIVLLLYYIFKSGRFNVAYIITPICILLLFIIFAFFACCMDDYGYCASLNWMFYVEVFLLITSSIVSFMKFYGVLKAE